MIDRIPQLSWRALAWMLPLALIVAIVPQPALWIGLAALAAVALPLIHPVFGVYLAILSVPLQEQIPLPGGVSLTQIAVALTLGAWGLRTLAHPERRLRIGWLTPRWVALLLALLFAACMASYSNAAGFRETARWGVAFLMYMIAVDCVEEPWQIAGLIVCLLAGPLAESLLGLWQFVSGEGPPSFRIAADSPYLRAYGTFGQPNSFAGYLNMGWPLALALGAAGAAALLRRGAGRWALAALPLAGAMLAALGASFSRGAWLGAALGLLALLATLGRRASLAVGAAALVGVVVIGLAIGGALPPALAVRLQSITRSLTLFDASAAQVTPENYAVVERMAHIQAGWRMFVAHPLTGVGPGNFSLAYPKMKVGDWFVSRGHAHNFYLHIAAESGVFGLLAYVWLIVGSARTAIQALRRADGLWRRAAAAGCCGIIAAVAGHNLFENLHVLNMGIQLAGIWALAEALGNTRSKEQEARSL